MSTTERPRRHPQNVTGPFYVRDGCCLGCEVPRQCAPTLFADALSGDGCYVSRQPESLEDEERMIHALIEQDLGCIRYAGADPRLLRRIAEAGGSLACDDTPPAVPEVERHIAVIGVSDGLEPRALAESFTAYVQAMHDGHYAKQGATVRSAVRRDLVLLYLTLPIRGYGRRRKIALRRHKRRANAWVYEKPKRNRYGQSALVHDWFRSDARVETIRWFSDDEWAQDAEGSNAPW